MLEAAQSVADDPASMDMLESLVSKSLLRQTETEGAPRLTMLETIREFGLEQLSQAGEVPAVEQRLAGGDPDVSDFLSRHGAFFPGANTLDDIIEQIRQVGFDDPKGIELGQEFVKLTVREMPTIPLMSYNVFTVMDTTYWTGFPNAETAPYTDPVPNWANTKYMMVKLKPRQ